MNQALQFSTVLTEEEKYILRTLLYFDIFSYPLTETEIKRFSPLPAPSIVTNLLEGLITKQLVFVFKGLYSIHNQPALAERRVAGNMLAEKK